MKEILEVLAELEQLIESEDKIRKEMGSIPLRPTTIRILGQMSLLLNEDISSRMHLFATQDVDAHIKGDSFVAEAFKRLLGERNLEFDFLSNEIWLPLDASYIQIYESPRLHCEILDPISALVSKAVKAPDKNTALISKALDIYGEELASKIKQHGVDPNTFKHSLKFKL
jgi:hypothetical protein